MTFNKMDYFTNRQTNMGGGSLYFDGCLSASFIYVMVHSYARIRIWRNRFSTTGEWKIKTSPSVTYGTNGFFILKE